LTASEVQAPRLTVLCMKWGTKYGPEYVNRLHAMVSRHLTERRRFLCLTDETAGLRPEIDTAPIPSLPPVPPRERGWRKLAAFSPEAAERLCETVLYLDLDVVVVGSLDPFLEHPGVFPMIRDWYHPFRIVGNSSVFRFRPAEQRGLFDDFRRNADDIVRRFRNEQEFVTDHLRRRGELSFWPPEWAPSYRVGCLPLWPWRAWRTPKPPPSARVIVFHGEPKPPEAIAGRKGVLQTYRPAPWLAEHWRE
jgi:hypothetical protein